MVCAATVIILPTFARAKTDEMPPLDSLTAKELLLWNRDTRSCGPSLPEPVPPPGAESQGSLPEASQAGFEGASNLLGVGQFVTVDTWVPCFAGTSTCTGGRHLNVGRVTVKYEPGGTAIVELVPYFPLSGAFCGNQQVGPIFRGNGNGFLDVHLGNTWLYDIDENGGGIVQVSLSVLEYAGQTCSGRPLRVVGPDTSTCTFYRKARNWQEPRGSKTWSLCGQSGTRDVCGCHLPNVRVSAPSQAGVYSYRQVISVGAYDFSGNLLAGDFTLDTCFKVDWSDSPPPYAGPYPLPAEDTFELPLWAGVDQCTGDVRIPLGFGQVGLLDVPPDLCVEDFRVQVTLRNGQFLGSVTSNQIVVPYLPLTLAFDSSWSCGGCADVSFSLTEYSSLDCTGPLNRSFPGDWARRWQLSEGIADEARADRGAYCDGQYGDPGGSWHLPDTVITYPGTPGYYSYRYVITVGQDSYCPSQRPAVDLRDEGCFVLFWAP